MNDERSIQDRYLTRPEIEKQVFELISEDQSLIHLSGEPGIGKTWMLRRIQWEYEPEIEVVSRNLGAHSSVKDLYRVLFSAIVEKLPDDFKEEGRKLAGLSASAAGFGAGIELESTSAKVPSMNVDHRDSLMQVSKHLPDNNQFLICLDDIHNLHSDSDVVRDAVKEAAGLTPSNVQLVTAGRYRFNQFEREIRIDSFTKDQSTGLLRQEFPDLKAREEQKIYDRLGGHPLYIGLLIETNQNSNSPKIPKGDVYEELEQRYLNSLTEEEEMVLTQTSPLFVLNKQVVSAVLPDNVTKFTVRRTLKDLENRVIVQSLGRNENHENEYKIHDVFREYLLNGIDECVKKKVHKNAFEYYSERILQLQKDSVDLHVEAGIVSSCLPHISENVAKKQSEAVRKLVASGLDPDGLNHYPAILILDEIKHWDANVLDEELIETVISKLENRNKIARLFFDEELHISWADKLFEEDWFKDPDNLALSYLNSITDQYPEVVIDAIKEADTDDSNVHRFLISISRDLPASEIAKVTPKLADWVETTEDYLRVSNPALRLHRHLCENQEYKASLTLIDPVLTPRSESSGQQFKQGIGISPYSITKDFGGTFDQLLEAKPRELVELLESKLRSAVSTDNDRKHRYLAQREPVSELSYSDLETSPSLDKLILEYFVESSTYWIDLDPDTAERQEFIERLLRSALALRRTGFYHLSRYPDVFTEIVAVQLTDEENYRDETPEYEFCCLLQNGFKHLENDEQQTVTKIITEGPYTDIEDQAKWYADNEDQISEIQTEIIRTWHRDRLTLIQNYLNKELSEYHEELVDEYGEPETALTDSRDLEARGGAIKQRGPEPLEKLKQQKPETLLKKAVSWVPPETNHWSETEGNELEEYNHTGFARQLGELISESPNQFAEEIVILRDGPSQYISEAFREFRDVLDEEQDFEWESIIELAQEVNSEPEEWSKGTRTNLADLLNKGIYKEHTSFPKGFESEVQQILLTMIEDPDPEPVPKQDVDSDLVQKNHSTLNTFSVRTRSLNALITYAWYRNVNYGEKLGSEINAGIADRITSDPSLVVKSVVGRRLGRLWNIEEDFVRKYLDQIFPRSTDSYSRKFFVPWNEYVSYHYFWDIDVLRPYYIYAIEYMENEEDERDRAAKGTASHIAAAYIFGDEELEDSQSLISRYFKNSSKESAEFVISSIASKASKDDELEEYWPEIQDLWEYRLRSFENGPEENLPEVSELKSFFDCVKELDCATLSSEENRISWSLQFFSDYTVYWRIIEEWLATESEKYPEAAIRLYRDLVSIVPDESWANTARTSQEEHRETLYENAAKANEDARQAAFNVANRFVLEGHSLDREFLDDQFY
ncbi:ATP-binding protein [Natrialbaceae archaeon A-chndr2]